MIDDREVRALAHISECIALIERDFRGDAQALTSLQRVTARSIMWSLFMLCDATTKLSDALKERHPEVPWAKVRGFRNFAAHAYERLQLEVVAAIIQDDLPPLKAVVDAELAALRRGV